jgi:hypothetical protein
MLKLQFYILKKTNLDPGGTYMRFNPDYSNLSLSFENRDNIAEKRLIVSGNLKIFREADFELFKEIYDGIGSFATYIQTNIADIKIVNASESYFATINLEQAYNESLRIFEGEFVLKDKYTQILDRKSSPITFTSISALPTVSISNINNIYSIKNTLVTQSRQAIITLPLSGSPYTLPAETNGLPAGFNLSDAEQDTAGITVVDLRILDNGFIKATSKFLISYEIDYFERAIATRTYTGADTFISDIYGATISFANYTLDNFDNITIEYSRFRDFYSVVRFVVSSISNDTILLDSSGTTTDSFYFLKNFQSEYLSNVFENLAICNLTNIFVNSALDEPNVAATRDNITFDMILKVFERFSLFWYIENRSGDLYLMTKHFSELVDNNGSVNLNNYKSRNWCRYANKFEIQEPDFTTVYAEQKSDYGEWQNVYMDFKLFTNTDATVIDNTKQLNLTEQNIFTDIDDVIVYNSDRYDAASVGNFILVGLGFTNFVLRGEVFAGTSQKNNVFLSHVYLYRNFLANLPSNVYNILNFNGSWEFPVAFTFPWGSELDYPIDDDRLAKRKKYEIILPLNYLSEISLDENVKYLGEWLQIEKGEINLQNSTIKLTLQKL